MARVKMREAGALGRDSTIETARGERQFASGDRIILLRNERGLGVKNGTLGTVAMASAQRMAVRTDDGREVAFDTKDYAHLDHGYAATIHKAQGMTVDRAHVLSTPGMDSHSAYVAMSRHRDGLALHYGRDDFADQSKLVRTLSRERGKDMAGDYKPEQAFAELRGITFRERIIEMVRQVPEKAKSIFGNFRPQSRPLEPVPVLANTQNEQRRAVERYARALGDIGTMQAQGLPILPHQKDALEKAGKSLDAIRPHAATDLAKALDRRPKLIAEAAGGRSQDAMRAMTQEAAVRTDPALRTERFVSDWQGLSAARKQLEQQGDRAGAARVSAKQNEMAKGLERDPQVESLLRGKSRELGIDPKPKRSIANELTATLSRERNRATSLRPVPTDRPFGRVYPTLVNPSWHHRPHHARELALARKSGSQGGWRTDHRGSGHPVDRVSEPRSLGRTGGGAGHTECKPRGAGTVQRAGPQLKKLNSLHDSVRALTCRCATRRNGALSCATCEMLQG